MKDGKRWSGGSVVVGGRRVWNPSAEQLAAAGYVPEEVQQLTLEEMKARKMAEIDAYDTSAAVNEFVLDGAPAWLDKATRVGLANSLGCEKSAGRETTTLWMGTHPITMGIARAQELLGAVELYALECYNRTAAHKAAVEAMETAAEVEGYDYTTGYPDKLHITTEEA